MRASYSRGAEGHIEEFGGSLRMFQPFGQDAERKGLDAGDRFIATRSIAQHARKVRDLGKPAAIFLAIKFNREGDAHGRTVARVEPRCRTSGCTRRRLRGGKGSRLCASGRRR